MFEIRNKLEMLSFSELIDYFDLSCFIKMMRTSQPPSLRKYVEVIKNHGTRGSTKGNVKLTFIPKSEKFKRSFLPRAYVKYNKLPHYLRFETDIKYLPDELKDFVFSGGLRNSTNNLNLLENILNPNPITGGSQHLTQHTSIQNQSLIANYMPPTLRPPPVPD